VESTTWRWLILGAIALLLAPGLLSVPAQSEPVARWHGPTGMNEGWHVRIPVTVHNPSQVRLENATVGRDILLAEELIGAGWVSSRQGSADRLDSFLLDERSIRVIEYTNFTSGGAPRPLGEAVSRVQLGALDQTRAYQNRTQPDVHVEWTIPGGIAPAQTRHFMIQLDTLLNGAKDSAGYAEQEIGELGGRYWISRGTLLFGVGSRVTLVATETDTDVLVEIHAAGGWTPAEFPDPNVKNPVRVQEGTPIAIDLGDRPHLVRLTSASGVIALGTSSNAPGSFGGPAPSTDDGIMGKTFRLPPVGKGYVVYSPVGRAEVTLDDGPISTIAPGSVQAFQTTPVGERDFHIVPEHVIRSNTPVLVFAWPDAVGKTQFATPWGTPVGSRLVGLPYLGNFCGPPPPGAAQEARECIPQPLPPCTTDNIGFSGGEMIVTGLAEESFVRGRDLQTAELTHPKTVTGRVSSTAATLDRGEPLRMKTEAASGGKACPVLLYATPSATEPGFGEAPLVAFGGRSAPGALAISTPIGGKDAREFVAYAPVNAVAYYDGTQIRVTQEGRSSSHGLGDGSSVLVNATLASPAIIHASKPVVLLPHDGEGYFAGIDRTLTVSRHGPAEYRGYLVGLRAAEGGAEPLVGVAGPGSPALYRLEVTNLAKDHLGRPVSDDIEISLDAAPPGWTFEATPERLSLAGGASGTVEVRLTPPPEMVGNAPLRTSVHARSVGNPNMADRVSIVTVVRPSYDIDMWFEQEGGVKSRSLVFDRDETLDVSVVVKNLAVIPDRVVLSATAYDPAWSIEIEGARSGFREVPLDAGQSRTIQVRITAPSANASTSLLEANAISLSDASAAAKVAAHAKIRVATNMALHAPHPVIEGAPGSTVRFRVELENRGEGALAAKFNASSTLPEGWAAPIVMHGEHAIDELSGILPHTSVPLDVTITIPTGALRAEQALIHMAVETLPQTVGDAIMREGLDLTLLVGLRRDLDVTGPGRKVDAIPGTEVEILLDVQNAGNGAETLRVLVDDLPPGVSMIPDPPLTVESPGTGTLRARLSIPEQLPAADHAIALKVMTQDGAEIPQSVELRVPERAAAQVVPLDPTAILPGKASLIRVEIVNVGNTALPLPPVFLAPDGWTIEASAEPTTLDPGGSARGTIALLAPRSEGSPFLEIPFAPDWAAGAPLEVEIQHVEVGRRGRAEPRRRRCGRPDRRATRRRAHGRHGHAHPPHRGKQCDRHPRTRRRHGRPLRRRGRGRHLLGRSAHARRRRPHPRRCARRRRRAPRRIARGGCRPARPAALRTRPPPRGTPHPSRLLSRW
jgi:uncharacterized membrane protein